MQAIKNQFDMPSNESALIRKGRKSILKCNSPCQVIPMIINTKAGFQTDISHMRIFPRGPLAGESHVKNWKSSKRQFENQTKPLVRQIASILQKQPKDIKIIASNGEFITGEIDLGSCKGYCSR